MKKTLIFILFISGLSFLNDRLPYKKMQYGDSLILTYDDNKGGLDWDNSGRRIAFESSFEESKNIYFIDFYDLPVTFSNNGFHYAKYINELTDRNSIYNPLAVARDTAFTSPKWNLTGKLLLSIGQYGLKNEVFISKRITRKTLGTKITDVAAANWKNDSILLVVKKNQPKQLLEISRKTLKSKVILNTKHNIIGISKQKNAIYLSSIGGVCELTYSNHKSIWFELPIKGQSTAKLGKLNFIGLDKNNSAEVLDLNNGTKHPFSVGENDGSPVISKDEKFVAFFSGYINGIVIKRVNKKFYLE
ncbi:MAG: hypothetical protein P8Q42_04760 [Flavobacteriales bacterium]|nr:hypothetical protein [Flavobacteriales bacterium]